MRHKRQGGGAPGGLPDDSNPELVALCLGALPHCRWSQPDLRGHADHQSRAWQPLCCWRLRHRVAGRPGDCAGPAAGLAVPPAALGGAVGGAHRHRHRTFVASTLLSPRRGIPVARHLRPHSDPRGFDPFHLGRDAPFRGRADGRAADHPYRRPALSCLQSGGDRDRRGGGLGPLGGNLSHQVRRHVASDVPRSAHGFGARPQCGPRLCDGVRDRLLHGGSRRSHRGSDPGGRAWHGDRCAGHRLRGRGDRRARQPQGGSGRGPGRELRADRRNSVLPGARVGGAVPHRRPGAAGAADRAVRKGSICCSATQACCRSVIPPISASAPTPSPSWCSVSDRIPWSSIS